MQYVLGIDGGGSKTTAALSRDGEIVASFTSGGCNLNRTPLETASENVQQAIRRVLADASVEPSDVAAVCAGVAGAASEHVAEAVQKMIVEVLPTSSVRVIGDMVIALDAAFRGAAGVVCVAGTGSIAFGRNERGDHVRAGGWGPIISDEGSGSWIGQRAVSECLRALDQGRSTSLVHRLLHTWRIATREELIARCHTQPYPNFAELFPAVLASAEEQDSLANEILHLAGEELAGIARIVMRRLWYTPTAISVAMSGGVFVGSAYIRQVFTNSILTERPDSRVTFCEATPVEGALYLAERMLSSAD